MESTPECGVNLCEKIHKIRTFARECRDQFIGPPPSGEFIETK